MEQKQIFEVFELPDSKISPSETIICSLERLTTVVAV